MLRVIVRSHGREQVHEHPAGPLELGRGPARQAARLFVPDPFVSRDHVLLEPETGGRLRIENLSQHAPIEPQKGGPIPPGAAAVVDLPARFTIGESEVEVCAVRGGAPAARPHGPSERPAVRVQAKQAPATTRTPTVSPERPAAGMETIVAPATREARPVALGDLGVAPDAETLAHWFETLVLVQQAASTSRDFLEATARALVDLVGLDRGLVLLREAGSWQVATAWPAEIGTVAPFSSTVVSEVARLGRTVFRNFGPGTQRESLVGIDTVVAAPVLGQGRGVVGVVYGSRSLRMDREPPPITPLEALVVQVLAGAVGAGIEREAQRENALRMRLQFEQFFSPRLASELATDPSLLEGREREVTVLFSDIRNFARISERLGARRTFDMMQEVMDLQSERIRQTDGVVVDYVGDGLLAMWNAPADQPDHPARACAAALGFLRDLPALASRWQPEAGEPLRLGVGIDTGPALVGNTGSRVKFKYGPMGPTVNLASRLENATKALGVTTLVTRATRDRLVPTVATRRLGTLRAQGFANPIEVFEVFEGEATPSWLERRDTFESALAHFEAGRWSEACRLLAGLLSADADYDIPGLQLLARSVECLRSRPEPFDPAIAIQKEP